MDTDTFSIVIASRSPHPACVPSLPLWESLTCERYPRPGLSCWGAWW